jgi:hypothetical protein
MEWWEDWPRWQDAINNTIGLGIIAGYLMACAAVLLLFFT